MEQEEYHFTIRFYDAKGFVVAEKEYVSFEKPTNGTIHAFATSHGIVYSRWSFAK